MITNTLVINNIDVSSWLNRYQDPDIPRQENGPAAGMNSDGGDIYDILGTRYDSVYAFRPLTPTQLAQLVGFQATNPVTYSYYSITTNQLRSGVVGRMTVNPGTTAINNAERTLIEGVTVHLREK